MVGQETSASRGIERVKISDVAVALSLTKGTVSRALNGYPDISESTRLKVRNAARRMGVRPSVACPSDQNGQGAVASALSGGWIRTTDIARFCRIFSTAFRGAVSAGGLVADRFNGRFRHCRTPRRSAGC